VLASTSTFHEELIRRRVAPIEGQQCAECRNTAPSTYVDPWWRARGRQGVEISKHLRQHTLTEAKPACACGQYLLNPLWIQWKKAAHVRLAPTLLRLSAICGAVTSLLALAHQHGLAALETTVVQCSPTWAVCQCTARFQDGRTFTDVGDASPDDVVKHLRPHFACMAVTRASARALRRALTISACSVEEVRAEAGS
jgi:hypothetical protein